MPERQDFIDLILDHYESPRHHGRIEQADLVAQGHNPGCGDQLTIFVKLGADERIVDLAFEGVGCTISQAGASICSEKVMGRTLTEVAAMTEEIMEEEMGIEVVASRLNCATLALNTLRTAGDRFHGGPAAAAPAENV